MNIKLIVQSLFIFCLAALCMSCAPKADKQANTSTSLKEYFKYKNDKSILISGHRGTRASMFPENSLEGMKHAVGQMESIVFEIDPRLTKDSVIVLMHDATLDRTTTATGKLSDYTWAELQDVRLKDYDGNVTHYKIPLLKDVIEWSIGRTVVNLDKKDVPFDMIVKLIKECKAEQDMMLTVHTGAQARYYYDRLPNIMFSVFARNNKEYEDIRISGVPWDNMIAYVGHTINEGNSQIVDKLHADGVKCMISTAPTHDKLVTPEERKAAYEQEISKNPDIIETDIPTELWAILNQ